MKQDMVQTYLRIRADVHKRATDLAWKKHLSFNALMNVAIEEYLADEEGDVEDD